MRGLLIENELGYFYEDKGVVMNKGIRHKILDWLIELWGGEPNGMIPKSLMPFACLLFPLKAFWWYNPWFKYNIYRDAFFYDNIWISPPFLRSLINSPPHCLFRIVNKEDETLTIEQFYFEDFWKDATYEVEFKEGKLYTIRRKYERHTNINH